MNQIFLLDTAKIAGNEFPKTLATLSDVSSYYFSVIWTQDASAISLTSVAVSIIENSWVQKLSGTITEGDGQISIPIGLFMKDASCDLIFSLVPHQNIAGAAIYITNHNTGESKKISPRTGSQPLTKQKAWSAPLTIKFF